MNIHLKTKQLMLGLFTLLSGISLNAGISHSKEKKVERQERMELDLLRDIIQGKDVKGLKELLENNKKINLNKLDSGFIQPLVHAVESGNLEIVALLVEKGADVNFVSENGLAPIILAAYKNDLDITSFLVDKGVDSNFVGIRNKFPLQCALCNASLKMFKLFVEQGGADLDRILNGFPNLLRVNPKFFDYIKHVKKYYEDYSIITQETLDQYGKLIDPEVIPNYLPLAVIKKNITQMNSVDISSDFNVKKHIIRMQLRQQDKRIIAELIWIYFKNNSTDTDVDEIIDKKMWKQITTQHHLFNNNKIKKELHDTHFLYI